MSAPSIPTPPGSGTAQDGLHERTPMQRLGHPAIDALRRTVQLTLSEVIGTFLRQLPSALTERARTTPFDAEQKICKELASMIGSRPDQWLDDFVRRVDTRLVGAISTAVQAPTEESDDVMVLTQAELRAQTQFASVIADLDGRLSIVRRTVLFPVRAGALSPAGLCRAMQDTATSMRCGGAHLRLLFGKFDEIVLPQLPRLYVVTLEALADIESRSAEAEALLQRETARAHALKARQPQPEEPPAELPKARPAPPSPWIPATTEIDPRTQTMLKSAALKPPSPNEKEYSDRKLAQDLLTLQTDAPLQGADIKPEERWVPLQRISLAGKFLNDAIEDPLVPEDLGPQHESVRFPLVKSAIADSTLFTAVTHPLRTLVNDLMLKSATSRVTGTSEARRMAEVLQQVLVQFDLAPDFVREAMLSAQPINEDQINLFFKWQKEQATLRKETVISEAKRLVIRELELRTFGRVVPPPALKFLNTFWGPLLVKALLQHGADNTHWRAGIDRMEDMLDQLEISDCQMPPPDEWQAMAAAMAEDLKAGGLAEDRVKRAVALLDAAWQAPKRGLGF